MAALPQVVTDIRLRRGGSYNGTGEWVWEKRWHDGRVEKEGNDRESGGGSGEAAPRGAKGVTSDVHAGESMSEIEGDALTACVSYHDDESLVPISEVHAEGITRTKKRRVAGIGRLSVLTSNVVTAVLPGLYNMRKLEFKGDGWGIDPRGTVGKKAPPTADNFATELPEH